MFYIDANYQRADSVKPYVPETSQTLSNGQAQMMVIQNNTNDNPPPSSLDTLEKNTLSMIEELEDEDTRDVGGEVDDSVVRTRDCGRINPKNRVTAFPRRKYDVEEEEEEEEEEGSGEDLFFSIKTCWTAQILF